MVRLDAGEDPTELMWDGTDGMAPVEDLDPTWDEQAALVFDLDHDPGLVERALRRSGLTNRTWAQMSGRPFPIAAVWPHHVLWLGVLAAYFASPQSRPSSVVPHTTPEGPHVPNLSGVKSAVLTRLQESPRSGRETTTIA